MNNRHIIVYRLQREGLGEIQVGWERVYELTPRGLMDKMTELSFNYDKAISVSFPEWWKSEKETDLPSLILNNIFGIIPDFDINENFTGIRLVNLATNEMMENFLGDEQHLLYVCKHILTYCKKVLRSWGKEPFREFRYGIEYLRDKWHLNNHKDAFQRPDVRIYGIVRYNRLPQKEVLNTALQAIENKKPDNNTFNYYDDFTRDEVYNAVKVEMLKWIDEDIREKTQESNNAEKYDLENLFWYLFDADFIYQVYMNLGEETNNGYLVKTYIFYIPRAMLSGHCTPSV